jgi:hypothetical protein
MYYILLGSVLVEFDQYLVIYVFNFYIAITTSKDLGLLMDDQLYTFQSDSHC